MSLQFCTSSCTSHVADLTFRYVLRHVRSPPTEDQPAILDSDCIIMGDEHYISKHYLPSQHVAGERTYHKQTNCI
jgi:hypothetical protein